MKDQRSLEALARQARYLVLRTVAESGAGHIGAPLSAIDILIALYFSVLSIRPEEPWWEERDRFILSKGHAAVGLYTVMALRGFFSLEELATFDQADSRLQGHPDMTRLPGLDASTGSLGQGLSFGVGVALAAQRKGASFHTFVLLGDGELQEGMVYEALHLASRYRLENLTLILDWNGLQQYGWPGGGRGDRRDPWEGLAPRALLEALGWWVQEVDGHNYSELIPALEAAKRDRKGKPSAIIARTVKGAGLSFTQGRFVWHARVPTREEVQQAAQELGIQEEPWHKGGGAP